MNIKFLPKYQLLFFHLEPNKRTLVLNDTRDTVYPSPEERKPKGNIFCECVGFPFKLLTIQELHKGGIRSYSVSHQPITQGIP